MTPRLLITLAGAASLHLGLNAENASIPLTGDDADGYFAVVGLNQEGNQTLAGISRDPCDVKFFDYPAYVNPNNPNNIYIMYVQPYRFGLEYPMELHPVSFGEFVEVGELRPASEAANEGVTFIEAVSEDDGSIVDGEQRRDFSDFNTGAIEFDTSMLTGVGTEVIAPEDITLILDGTEFNATNRKELLVGPDRPPFGINGRSNRNEAFYELDIAATNLAGEGLIFQGGLLTSIDIQADAMVGAAGGALGASADLQAGLTFLCDRFAYDADDQVSSFFASNVRLILNREGTIDAVGSYVVPGTCAADFNGDDAVDAADVNQVVDAIELLGVEYNCDAFSDAFDVARYLTFVALGCVN
ncbi:MAG: hypothetical protein AAGI30_07790 [Planctomycetota bacterium]